MTIKCVMDWYGAIYELDGLVQGYYSGGIYLYSDDIGWALGWNRDGIG